MSFNQYRQSGFTTLPNALINYRVQLGLTDAQFLLVVLLEQLAQAGNDFPSNQLLSQSSNLNASEIGSLIQSLIEQGNLEITQSQDQAGKIGNHYSLDPLYTKLDQLLAAEQAQITAKTVIEPVSSPVNDLVRQFEIEFGRLLTPIEREEIMAWLTEDHYDPEIISLALREAVLQQVYNFKYIDRILLTWGRMNLRTKEQVQAYLGRSK